MSQELSTVRSKASVRPGADPLIVQKCRIFEKGRDRSFTECSDFARHGGGWRYLRGVLRPGAPAVTRIDAYLAG